MLTSIGWVSRAERAAEEVHNEEVRRKDQEMAQQKQRLSDLVEGAEAAVNNFEMYSYSRKRCEEAFQSLRYGGPGLYGMSVANPQAELNQLEDQIDSLTRKIEDSEPILRSAVSQLYGALQPLGVSAPASGWVGAARTARNICQLKGIQLRPPRTR